MAHTYSSMHVHIVFATKGRKPFLEDPELRSSIHAYLSGTSVALGFKAHAVGGVEDHVHLLLNQSRSMDVSYFVQELKKASTKHIRSLGVRQFSWQGGYGSFSFAKTDLPRLFQYVNDQVEHHKTVTYQQELRQLLLEAGIPEDEIFIGEDD